MAESQVSQESQRVVRAQQALARLDRQHYQVLEVGETTQEGDLWFAWYFGYWVRVVRKEPATVQEYDGAVIRPITDYSRHLNDGR